MTKHDKRQNKLITLRAMPWRQRKAYKALRRVLRPDPKARAIQARLDVERINLEASDMLAAQDLERERFQTAKRGLANG